ncbi:transcription factor HHO2 [Silene latifolia]|uniref:transcription factor HHO2 n=1 Tax=Silene latifolia TaxID=37657 RepID=UPI003D7768D7
MMDFRENMQKCQEYVHGLEEEKKKIQVFKRELPLCLELVTQAIEACRRQLSGTSTTTECLNEFSEQTTSNGPILEEFIPMIKSHSDDDGDEHECDKPQTDIINLNISTNDNMIDNSGKKSDWLRSVQLWNQTLDTPTNQEDQEPKKDVVVEVKNNNGGGAFHPFMKENRNCNVIGNMNDNSNLNDNGNIKPTSMPTASACSSAEAVEDMTGSGSGSGSENGKKKEEKNGQSERKSRRCWSPELHRRFLHALQQLGGAHVATPKQIRELMKVDGLTNDEVKSHLQKYRLHTRRPTSTVQNHANPATPQPQFVVVGGIWVPPQEFSIPQTTNNIYTPVASTPRQQQKLSSHLRGGERSRSPSDGFCGRSSNSHTTSSSTHTTTASHAF